MKQVHCPECGRAWEDDGSLSGQTVVCPNCTEVFVIAEDPSQAPAVAAEPSALDSAADDSAEPALLVETESREIAAPPIVIAPPAPPLQKILGRKPSVPPDDELATAAPLPMAEDDRAATRRQLVNALLGLAFFLIALICVIFLAHGLRQRGVASSDPLPEKSTDAWIDDLQGHAAAARRNAAAVIVQRGSPALIEALDAITAIQSDNRYQVVRPAVEALAARGPEILKPLREALRSKRAGVRIGAVSVLCAMGSKAKGAIHPLGDVLGDDNRWVRRLAIESLGNCGADAAPATLKLIPLLTHEDRVTRLLAVVTLTHIGPGAQDASDALVKVRDHDPDSEVRQAALSALYQVDLDRVVKEANEQATEEVQGLIARLTGKDRADRVIAANALAAKGWGAVHARAALAKALCDQDKWLREASAKALGSMGDAAEPTIPNLQRLATDPEPEVQAAAEQALKDIRGKML
jgi:HEAT repeat protein